VKLAEDGLFFDADLIGGDDHIHRLVRSLT
jgi:hypothetical protein